MDIIRERNIERERKMNIPNGLDEIIECYGNPDSNNDLVLDRDFYNEQIVKRRLPFPLRCSWNLEAKSINLLAHKDAVEQMCAFFESVAEYYGGYEELKALDYDIWGGSFLFRPKRGGRTLSTHSWGIAFDYLPQLAPMGKPSLIPDPILLIGEKLGFINGGGWKVPDGMHNQLCSGY